MGDRRGTDLQRTAVIAAQGTIEIAPKPRQGYQECGLTGKAAATASGLSTTTAYYLFVAINGGASTEYTFSTAGDTTFADVIALLNAAITGVTFSLVNGDLRCTSNSTGAGSAVAMAAGTTGDDFFAALTGFSAIEAAVKPIGGQHHLTQIDIDLETLPATGLISLSDGTNTLFGPYLTATGNGNHIRLAWSNESPYMWTADSPINIVCATADVKARCTVKGYNP